MEGVVDAPYMELVEIMQAETLLFKGILKILESSRVKAFFAFKQSWKIYAKFEKRMNALDADAQSRLCLGLGIFYLGISTLPGAFSSLCSFIGGFSGDKKLGLGYLARAIEAKGSRACFAALLLGLFHLEIDPHMEEVCRIMERMLRAFPNCALFQWVTSMVAFRFTQLDDAVYLLERALSVMNEDVAQNAGYIKYELGWFYFLKLEFDECLPLFHEVVAYCTGRDLGFV